MKSENLLDPAAVFDTMYCNKVSMDSTATPSAKETLSLVMTLDKVAPYVTVMMKSNIFTFVIDRFPDMRSRTMRKGYANADMITMRKTLFHPSNNNVSNICPLPLRSFHQAGLYSKVTLCCGG